jgi:hypothetical protein
MAWLPGDLSPSYLGVSAFDFLPFSLGVLAPWRFDSSLHQHVGWAYSPTLHGNLLQSFSVLFVAFVTLRDNEAPVKLATCELRFFAIRRYNLRLRADPRDNFRNPAAITHWGIDGACVRGA